MITRLSRGRIEVEYNGRTVMVEAEALLPGHGSPNYIIYSSSITGWQDRGDSAPFTARDKAAVLEEVKRELDRRNITWEVE